MQAILRKFWVKAQKHDKMDGAEKLLSFNFTMSDDSCIPCNSIVRMIRIFSGTDMIQKVPICLFEVPICLIEVPNCPGADLSWYRNVSHRCRSVLAPICPGAEVSRILNTCSGSGPDQVISNPSWKLCRPQLKEIDFKMN